MLLKKWDDLPENMQTDDVKVYYDALKKRRLSLLAKRIFDFTVALIMLILLSPVFLILAVAIKIDSRGPVFYRQVRVTQYGKTFRIFKFRSMTNGADKQSQLTTKGDARITRVGKLIRKFRLDEISQLIDVLRGKMTFVGTRPEVPKFTDQYTPEMMATLLLPAGITSLASIYYKDEAELLDSVDNADAVYVEKVLPDKMYYNLKALKEFSFFGDIAVMFKTAFAMLGKEYIDLSRVMEEKKEEVEV